MGQGIQFIDIIFLGLVAGFLVLRLRSVLGRRTGEEKPRDVRGRRLEGESPEATAADDNVIELPSRDGGRKADRFVPSTGEVEAGLTRIAVADPSFEPDRFLEGARAAFEMIVAAFAKGDSKALRPLLADDVYTDFDTAIRQREADGRVMETEIAALTRMDITAARLQGDVALITVRFVSEQMVLVKDSEDRVVEGDPTRYETVTDDWTFARNTATRDPNWQLVATEAPEDSADGDSDIDP
jgi:predicted lipid-binding transport protein (Tim44 family)